MREGPRDGAGVHAAPWAQAGVRQAQATMCTCVGCVPHKSLCWVCGGRGMGRLKTAHTPSPVPCPASVSTMAT